MGSVVIVGAGPGGATLALLLARQGIRVTLLERRRDFAREFRGEVLMPSGVDALQQMGLDGLLSGIPTREVGELEVHFMGRQILALDLQASALRGHLPVVVAQPRFLQAVVEKARESSAFQFRPGTAVTSLLREGERVVGVNVREAGSGAGEANALRADLVVGADGRNSIVRGRLGVHSRSTSPPMDVVWCKLPCPDDWAGARAYLGRGHFLLAYRTWDDSLQLAWVILKGTFGELRSRGVDAWVEDMARHVSADLARPLKEHLDDISRPFLLDTVSDRAEPWSEAGAVLIGDAAHAMSPVGAQGLNLALRDAIVAANHFLPALTPIADPARLTAAAAAFEAERMPEVRRIQRLQALPPAVVLNRAWYGEVARRVLSGVARFGWMPRPAMRAIDRFLFGVTRVTLDRRLRPS